MKLLTLIVLPILLIGCATTKRGKVVETAIYSSLTCGVLGAATAPNDENPNAHGLMWGGVCGTAGALASEFIYRDDEDAIKELKIKNSQLLEEIRKIQNNSEDGRWATTNLLERELPEEFKDKIIPGKWRVRRVVKESKDKKSITVGKELEIIPPQLISN